MIRLRRLTIGLAGSLAGMPAIGQAPRAPEVVLTAEVGSRELVIGSAGSRLGEALTWKRLRAGLELSELTLHAGTLRTPITAVIVRADPGQLRFALDARTAPNGMTGTWTLDSASSAAAVAMNAGQFRETGPWGWVVLRGEELRSPLAAPLAAAIRIDSAGRIRWVPPGGERGAREEPGTAYAFQSYPVLLFDHRAPGSLSDTRLMEVRHRDARLVLAELDDGTLLFVLTRFAALGPLGGRVPIGLTTLETLALVRALGARHALMLDGGVSAQLLVRDSSGVASTWPSLRRVPLALTGMPRQTH